MIAGRPILRGNSHAVDAILVATAWPEVRERAASWVPISLTKTGELISCGGFLFL